MRRCPACSSHRFNRSQMRAADVPAALVLMLPVRCYDCRQRYLLPVTTVFRSGQVVEKQRHPEPAATRPASEG